MNGGRIRLLIIADASRDSSSLQAALARVPELEVTITDANPDTLLRDLRRIAPQVVCLDVPRPAAEAITLTRLIMASHPVPILVLATSADADTAGAAAFRTLDEGALDLVRRPKIGAEPADLRELVAKIRVAAGVRVFQRHAHRRPTDAAPDASRDAPQRPRVVIIGASTGGPPALVQVLTALPQDFPLPIVCVQHITQGFLEGFAKWLDGQCHLRVKQADAGERPAPGTVYLPRDDRHLVCDAQHRLRLSLDPPVDGHRPSVTTTMCSFAEHHRGRVIAVLLTGMGRDGAAGMAEVHRRGGATIVQDAQTSIVFGMPAQAIALGAAHHVLPLPQIAAAIVREANHAR